MFTNRTQVQALHVIKIQLLYDFLLMVTYMTIVYVYVYMYVSPVGEGVHKLVSVIRAQHQAWSERLAARASLLQSTISQMEEDATPPASLPTPPEQQSEVEVTHSSHATPHPQAPTHQHFQEEQRALHTHPNLSAPQSEGRALNQHSTSNMHIEDEEQLTTNTHPRFSSRQDGGEALHVHQYSQPRPTLQDEGGALNHHHAPLSQNQARGGVRHSYPCPQPTLNSQGGKRTESKLPPSLLSHGDGGTEDIPLSAPPKTSASHHDSLSIFTLSTRYMYMYDGNFYHILL